MTRSRVASGSSVWPILCSTTGSGSLEVAGAPSRGDGLQGSREMRHLVLRRSFWRTASRVPSHVRSSLRHVLSALDDEWPDLPSEQDVDAMLPPVRHCSARRISSSSYWVFFEVTANGVIILAVAEREV